MIIVGASARAAAASALRAGFAPWCVDLFADADLARACPVRRVSGSEYPHGLPAVLAEAPPGPWVYTGAMENYPRVVERIAWPLLGNPAAVLRRVRDPRLVQAVLSRHGLRCPEIAAAQPDKRRAWLVKPRRSAGGAHIRAWSPGAAWDARRCYLQERIAGDSYAALYVGRPCGTDLVGITRQLVGEPWLHAARFHYCGSVGPVDVSASVAAALEQIGNILAAEFGLRGLFGVDFILNRGEPWPVEVNPRYTASVEIIERATERALIAEHVEACGGSGTFGSPTWDRPPVGLLNPLHKPDAWARIPPSPPGTPGGEGSGVRGDETPRANVAIPRGMLTPLTLYPSPPGVPGGEGADCRRFREVGLASTDARMSTEQLPVCPIESDPRRPAIVGQNQSSSPRPPHVHGKAILFAPATFTFPSEGPWDAALKGSFADVNVAFGDLPHAGAVIDGGAPVLTAFAVADSVAQCINELRRIATDLYRLFDAAVK